MRYVLAEVDVGRAIPTLEVPGDASGAGVLVRLDDRPVAFFMTPLEPGCIGADQFRELIWKNAGLGITAELLRRDLVPEDRVEDPLSANDRTPPLQAKAGQRPALRLTIAICTRDHPALVERAIRSMIVAAKAAEAKDGFEILVVDNAPSDERTREVAEGFACVRYVREPRPGLDFARNCAVAEARGEILAFVDDDAVVDRGWMVGLWKAWSENPDAAAVTGPVIPYELETMAQILFEARGSFGRPFQARRFGPEAHAIHNYPCNSGYLGAGCNMAFRRSVLMELGGFDEALDTGAPLPGGGDLDILYRILRAGHTVVREPRLMIRHQHRKEYRQLRHQMYTWGLGTMAYAFKNWREDRAQRGRFTCMMLGWFREVAKRQLQTAAGRQDWRLDLGWAELWGGMVGVCGEYGRSKRRIARIRKRFA